MDVDSHERYDKSNPNNAGARAWKKMERPRLCFIQCFGLLQLRDLAERWKIIPKKMACILYLRRNKHLLQKNTIYVWGLV